MKITKRQLRRIIKEEKAKLHEGIPESQVDYAYGAYTPVEMAGQLENLMNRLWGEVLENAVIDGLEDDEGAELANLVLVKILAEHLDSVGETQFAHELKRYL